MVFYILTFKEQSLRWTNKLQRVLNAAACVVSGTHKFDRGLSRLLHTELHWLDVPEWVVYKLGIVVFNCLHSQAPQYLVELCQPVAGVASRQHLWSAIQQLLVVPHYQLSSYGRQAFCVAGPSVWNSLPDNALYKSTFYLLTYLPADLGSVSSCLCGIGGIGMTLSYNCFCAA